MLLVDLAPAASTLADLAASVDVSSVLVTIAVLAGLVFAARMLSRRLKAIGARKGAAEALWTNWQLTLLAATGVILSLASGWTTWDGMRNFTQEPLLSLMITFGIQGVMLIVAWLIGESFATGMNYRPKAVGNNAALGRAAGVFGTASNVAGMVIGSLLAILAGIYIFNAFVDADGGLVTAGTLTGLSNSLLFAAMLIAILAGILIAAGGQILGDYVQGLRVMIRGAVLWIMFLACMGTSVFFSFDSLFTTIFPQTERERAAELRAQNEVAGVVSDVSALTTKRQLSEIEALFGTQGWQAYRENLDRVIALANRAPGAIRAQIAADIESRRARVAELEEKRASASSGQAELEARKQRLTEELARAKDGRPEAAAGVAEYKSIVGGVEKRLDEQRAFMLAEERGVEGSGKVGRGKMWRAARANFRRIEAELEVANRRLSSNVDRLTSIDRRISQVTAELAQVDGSLAQLKGEAQTADQLIAVAETNNTQANATVFDPTASVASLERAILNFRRQPAADGLATIQKQCLAIQAAASRVKSGDIASEAAGINCDPGVASEAAARVFGLNTGVKALQARCVGGDKLPQSGGADALFTFARTCLQDSGLPSGDTTTLRRQIQLIEINRDDKAHRFVVTSNAFGDGNKLAYLALAIAIAIDALVFMSGLFGANALRSPLSDVPSHKGRSARQLETIVANALLPDTFETATHALEQIHPMAYSDVHLAGDAAAGWTHEVILPPIDVPQRARLVKVLNAGATIGAVHRDPAQNDRFFVRGEFVEYLATAAKTAFDSDGSTAKLAELKKILVVALQPFVGDHANVVLNYLKPISHRDGYSSEVMLNEVTDPHHLHILRKAMNAGATLDVVHQDDRRGEEDRYYIHRDYYRTLALVAAEFPMQGRILNAPLAATPVANGGTLEADTPQALEDDLPRTLLNDERRTRKTHPPEPTTEDLDRTERLRDLIASEFHAALRVTPEQIAWAETYPGAAADANALLNELVASNEDFGGLVYDVINDTSAAIQKAATGLAARYRTDADALDVLTEERRQIEELLPLLLLAPNGGYTRILQIAVTQLEEAAGEGAGLSPQEEVQQARLRQHLETFGKGVTVQQAVAEVRDLIGEQRGSKVAKFPGVKHAG